MGGGWSGGLPDFCLGRDKLKALPDLKLSGLPEGRVTTLLSLEHLNVNVPAWNSELEIFWMQGLGFKKDKRAETVCGNVKGKGGSLQGLIWANAGLQQIHMPLGEPAPSDSQNIPGFIGLAYENLVTLRSTLKSLSIGYGEVPTSEVVSMNGLGPPAMKVKSPTGVTFIIHSHRSSESSWVTPNGWKSTKELMAQKVQLQNEEPSTCLGIPYIRLMCPHGTAISIGRFYGEIFQTKAEIRKATNAEECWVPIGASQWLIYREAQRGETIPYDGYHIAIYINDFLGAYHRAKLHNLLWNNPRFPNLTYDTEDLALKHTEFRILNLIDPTTGEFICQLEHEIRAASHPSFCAKNWLGSKDEK